MYSRREIDRAILKVGQLERAGHVVGLIEQLQNPAERGRWGEVRGAAAAALGRLGDPRAEPALIALSRDPAARVRVSVIGALARVGSAASLPVLRAALRDDDRVVRCLAAEGLGRFRAAVALEELRAASHDEDGWVRLYAAEALAAIGDPALWRHVPEELGKVPWWDRERKRRWQRLLTAE